MSALIAVLLALPPISHLIGETPEGHVVAVGGSAVWVLDPPNDAVVRRIDTTAGSTRTTAMRPDGKAALVASRHGIERIDLVAGQRQLLLTTRSHALAYAPDGKTFASIETGWVALRSADDGTLRWREKAGRNARGVAVAVTTWATPCAFVIDRRYGCPTHGGPNEREAAMGTSSRRPTMAGWWWCIPKHRRQCIR